MLLGVRRIVFLAYVIASISAFGSVAGDPSTYQPFEVSSAKYQVELVAWERLEPDYASSRFRFRVLDLATGEEGFFMVENGSTSIDRGEIAGDRLLLTGDVQGLATGLTVVDLHAPEVESFHLSYGGSLSPDGTLLVYLKFYPRTVAPRDQKELLMAAELASVRDAAVASTSSPLYPEDGDGAEHRVLAQAGFLWLDSPLRIVFVDVTDGDPWLVVADLSRGLTDLRFGRRRIEIRDFLKGDPAEPGYQRSLEEERSLLSAVGLRRGEGDSVAIELSPARFQQGVFRVTAVSIELPHVVADDPPQGSGS